MPGGALPELQLQQRHRAVTVRGEGGHQPAVQPRSTLSPGTEGPCPRSPSSPERGQSLPELSRGDAETTHGCQPGPSAVPAAAAAVPDVNLRGARSAAVSSPPAGSLGLSCREFKQKVYLHLIFRNYTYFQITDCACREQGRAQTNSDLCCVVSHSNSSVIC